MNRIDDPKIAFYLKNQVLIDEWAGLAKGATDATHAFLCSLASDLARVATEVSPIASLNVQLDGNYPKLLLHLPAWVRSNDAAAALRVGIGLEWHRESGLGFTKSPKCAYAGVWSNLYVDGGKDLSRSIRSKFADSGLLRQRGIASHEWWPAYRYEVATGDFWNDLSAYRSQLVESVRFFWDTFAAKVQESIG